jgi:hypothetical protein
MRAFAAAKRNMIVDAGGRQIDHHHSGFGIALEVARVFEARGAVPEVSPFGIVRELERLIIVLRADDGGDGPKISSDA